MNALWKIWFEGVQTIKGAEERGGLLLSGL